MGLMAGAARTAITPPVGVDLCGFGARGGPSNGVRDDLRACALYLAHGGQEAMILTADLIGLHRDEVAQVRAGVEAACGVAPTHTMVCCSHTHSGPATHCIRFLGKQDDAYLAGLKRHLIGLAQEAKSLARPAVVRGGSAPVQVGVNRRARRADGGMSIGVNAEGPVAPFVSVLAVDDVHGQPLARLFSHAAHPVTLRNENLRMSGDWPGEAQRQVEEVCDAGCVALYAQGCSGNINSDEHGEAALLRQGRMVAEAAVAASEAAQTMEAPVLAGASVRARLPLMAPPSKEKLEQIIAQAEAEVARQQAAGGYGTVMMYGGFAQWGRELLEMGDRWPRELPFEVQALRVGDLALVGLPGEVFVEYQLNIAARSPFPQTLVAAYTNGNEGYIPTAAAYLEGGYEVETAIRFYGTTMPQPQSEELILSAAAQALEQLGR
jgi:neutral ceramidase